jgi:hypothetical protein
MPRLRSLLTLPNVFRIVLLIICVQAIGHLREEKPPWKSAWGRHKAEGVDPSFREHVATGLWYGAVARAGIAGAILLLSLGWRRTTTQASTSTQKLLATSGAASSPSPVVFYSLLGAVLAGALAMRAPRMTHSLWGDEADALATYVHGMYKPLKKKDRQGPVYFEGAIWPQTFFSARHGPNNHVLFSASSRLCLEAWRKITSRKDTEFTEWVARIPSLIGGLVSLAGLALLLQRWGVPWLGLLATLFMALHPWHVRYSAEARGYALALAFYPVLLLALSHALDRGRWRAWLTFGLLEFLIMYSWAGMAYAMALVNLVAMGLMVSKAGWVQQMVRWVTVNLVAAMLFISLYAPHVPQIAEAHERLQWLRGLPMDAVWFHNLVAEFFTGIPYHRQIASNPGEISWEGLMQTSPALTYSGFALIILAFLTGLVGLWKWHRQRALLIISTFAAVVLCTVHFKFGIKDELRSWYLIFALPALSITVAFGLSLLGRCLCQLFRVREVAIAAGVTVSLLIIAAGSLWAMNWSQMHLPFEDYRGVLAASREKHESFSPKATSNVLMCWLWRYSAVYDPRGEIQVRSGPGLRARMEEIKSKKGELYMVVGFRTLAESSNAEIIAMVEDPALFEKVRLFPSRQSIQMMELYRMR